MREFMIESRSYGADRCRPAEWFFLKFPDLNRHFPEVSEFLLKDDLVLRRIKEKGLLHLVEVYLQVKTVPPSPFRKGETEFRLEIIVPHKLVLPEYFPYGITVLVWEK